MENMTKHSTQGAGVWVVICIQTDCERSAKARKERLTLKVASESGSQSPQGTSVYLCECVCVSVYVCV